MNERAHAEEHLRVIRSLMERATVYRAISAPTALVGGVLSLLPSFLLLRQGSTVPRNSLLSLRGTDTMEHFIVIWGVVLFATLVANTLFIWRKARRERTPLITSGLRLAIKSALPVLTVAGVLTFVFSRGPDGYLLALVLVWIIFYGLALLATGSFAPPSLQVLGWAFLLTGVVCIFLVGRFNDPPAEKATIAMAVTFGVYHLIYGACTWPRKPEAA